MDLNIPAESREYLYIPGIAAFHLASPDAAANPTTLPVEVAFPATGTPPTAWLAAEWVGPALARILLGPLGNALDPGVYDVWLRITGAVEEPQRRIARLSVA